MQWPRCSAADPGRRRRGRRSGHRRPYLDIEVNREATARYGVNVGDIQDVIETALGGTNLTPHHRGPAALPDPGALPAGLSRRVPARSGNVLVAGADRRPGAARARWRTSDGDGAQRDRQRERAAARLRAAQRARPRPRRLRRGGASARWRSSVKLPPGYYVEWSGQYENQLRARQRCSCVVPVVLCSSSSCCST